MNKAQFIRTLLGIALALLVGPKCAAQQITIVASDSSCQVSSVDSGQMNTDYKGSSMPNFNGGLTSDSSDDGSAASVDMIISYRGGGTYTFQGWGKVAFKSGTYNLMPSQLAGGEVTTYLSVIVNVPFHYEYAAACESVSNVDSANEFRLGEISGNSELSESGNFPAGINFTLSASCNNNGGQLGGSAVFTYVVQLTPLSVPPRFTAAQKTSFYNDATMAIEEAQEALAQSRSTTNAQLSASLLETFATQSAHYASLFSLYLDPLDTNYTVLAQVSFPPVTPLVASNGITQLEANAYNVWLTSLSQSVGYSAALNTSVNRAQGAAYVSNNYWSTLQINAAFQFEALWAAVLDQEPALRSNVVAQFQAGGFSTTPVTTNEAIAFQMEIASNGLPTNAVEALTDLGLDGFAITNIQAGMITADPGTWAGSFPQLLVNTNFDAAQFAAASSLRDASLQLINSALLPGGQFRFDVPTEPGYTYTIQFTENLANPTGWTTLLSTNATTALLSFTNASPQAHQAAFSGRRIIESIRQKI